MLDAVLNSDGLMSLDSKGDIAVTSTIDTKLLCVLFFKEKENNKKGHFSFNSRDGSKLWLAIDQSRLDSKTISNTTLYIEQALNKLIASNDLAGYSVDVAIVNYKLTATLELKLVNGNLINRVYEL